MSFKAYKESYQTGHGNTQSRDYTPIVADADTQRWFFLRQDVPIGFEMLIIKNNVVEERYRPGMRWTSSMPIWHKRGVKTLLVDMRDRFEDFMFDSELYTQDQYLIELKFAVHYRVKDPEKIALHVKQPLEQLIVRTRSRVLDVTLRYSIDDFIQHGSGLYVTNMANLSHDFDEIGLEYQKVNVINFKLPDIARDKFAKVMGDNREMLMEIDRLKLMKDKGVINDYMKLELIKGLSNSSFPPLQLYAMQMLGLDSRQAGVIPTGGNDTSKKIVAPPTPALSEEKKKTRETGPGASGPTEESQRTLIKKLGGSQAYFVNLVTDAVYVLEKDVTTWGRSPENDVVLKDDYVSRHQLQVVKGDDDKIIIINLSDNNPIMINGDTELRPGERKMLKVNDVLEFGYSKLKLIKR